MAEGDPQFSEGGIDVTDGDRIRVIALDRPAKRNALSTAMLTALDSALTTIRDGKIRVVIIQAKGPAFSAGADISEYSTSTDYDFQRFTRLANEVCSQIQQLGVPVIASVKGMALGGGFELALSCDLIIAGADAQFGLPELNLGLIPGWGGTRRLTHLIGPYRTRHLLLSGQRIGAEDAQALGIVSEVVPNTILEEATHKLALHIAEQSPSAVEAGLAAIRAVDSSHISSSAANSVEQMELFSLFNSTDAREGLQAFLQKRRPNFTSDISDPN